MARLLDFLTWGWRSYRRNLRWVVDFFKSRYLVGQARKHCCTFCIISYAVLQSASLCTIVLWGEEKRVRRVEDCHDLRGNRMQRRSHFEYIECYVATLDSTHIYVFDSDNYMRNIHPPNASKCLKRDVTYVIIFIKYDKSRHIYFFFYILPISNI